MLIEQLNFISAEKTVTGYKVEIDMETADGMSFGGSIDFDKDWNYSLGFLGMFVNTNEDRYFVNKVLSSDDFKNDILSYIKS